MPAKSTIERAIKIIDGVREITKNEMLTKGVYIDHEITRPDLAEQGAICGGRRACLLGSTWIAAGVRVEVDHWGYASLPGLDGRTEVDDFLRHRPALKLAYEKLNEAAHRKILRDKPDTITLHENDAMQTGYEYGGTLEQYWASAAEALFEETDIEGSRMLRFLAGVRRDLENMLPEATA